MSTPHNRHGNRFRLGALWLGVMAAVVACGGGDDGREREQVRDVLTDSLTAVHAGDARKACSLYTPAYVRETLKENSELKLGHDTCEELVRALERVLKQLTPDPKPRITEVEVAGDKATARMEIDTHLGPAASKFFVVRQDGNWRIDHDEDLQDETQSPAR